MPVTPADLVVEDGTGLATANSYDSLANVEEYHRLAGNEDAWAELTENDKVLCLLNATTYMDRRWSYVGSLYNEGDDVSPRQALSWPRIGVYDREGVLRDDDDPMPQEILDIFAEYCLEYGRTGIFAEVLTNPEEADTNGRTISAQRNRVGPLEEEIEYDTGKGKNYIPTFTKSDQMMLQSGFVLGTALRSVRA